MTFFLKSLFKLSGWEFEGEIPYYLQKGIWAVCPHWSSWDFVIGICAKSSLGIKIGYLGKDSLFKWYSAWFFKGLGGFPVDRSKSNNLVDDMANTFAQHDVIHIALAPESTRKDVDKLRTGFYYMALKARVPIVPACFDYKKKQIHIGKPIYLTGNYEADMKLYYDFFLQFEGVPHKKWLQDYITSGLIS